MLYQYTVKNGSIWVQCPAVCGCVRREGRAMPPHIERDCPCLCTNTINTSRPDQVAIMNCRSFTYIHTWFSLWSCILSAREGTVLRKVRGGRGVGQRVSSYIVWEVPRTPHITQVSPGAGNMSYRGCDIQTHDVLNVQIAMLLLTYIHVHSCTWNFITYMYMMMQLDMCYSICTHAIQFHSYII